MKKNNEDYLVCDRCGTEFVADVDKKDFKPYGKLEYVLNSRECFGNENYNKKYSINGHTWDAVDLCPKCTYILHTLLGLYGFNKLKAVYGEEYINII